jgi:uncharacterized protein YndB with AHSA1/START domain
MPRRSDLDSIVWRVHFRSSPERVYEFLASDRGRAAYWAESAAEVGGVIEFRFINGLQTSARVLERDPPRRFRLEYFGTSVRFDLAPDGAGGTDLTMINSGVPPEDRDDVLPGWLNVLLPMKAAVDFGVDLRSHDPERTWEKRFVDQ